MKKLVIVGLLFAVALSFTPLLSFAQGGLVPCGVGNPGDPGYVACGLCHLFQLVNNIINLVMFTFIPIIAPIFIVIGGIYFLIGRGSPETYTKGKTVLTATVVGLIIVYTAWVLLNTMLTFLGVASWTGLGNWWQIECPL